MANEFEVRFSDGSTTLYRDSWDAAVLAVREQFDASGIVVADDWDADGQDADGNQMQRKLVWESEEDAENDSGEKAVAQICRQVPANPGYDY